VIAEIVSVPTFPDAWSTIIGDAIQNIRIALEYLVYELIRVETGVYWERSKFPIATDPSRHDGKETIARLGRHWKVIEGCQPYDTGPGTSLDTMLFEYLRTLSNRDKHQLLVPVASTMELVPSIFFRPLKDCKIPRRAGVWVNAGVLVPGADLLRETFQVTGPDPQVHVAETYPPLVSFADPDLAQKSAADILHMIHCKAEKLICEFKPLF
jgi:hypothetical protein